MIAVTGGFLGVGFWLTYRTPAPATGPACDCEKPAVNRAGRIGLWVVTALVAGFLAFPRLALPANGASTATAPATTQPAAIRAATTLHVEGMTCASCAVAIETALGKLDGVLSTEVDVEGEKATVTYDPAKVTPDAIAKKVRDLGYPATAQE